jgi:hypothetical protein
MAGTFTHAKTVRSPMQLPVKASGGYTEFTIPRLNDYELVVLN